MNARNGVSLTKRRLVLALRPGDAQTLALGRQLY